MDKGAERFLYFRNILGLYALENRVVEFYIRLLLVVTIISEINT